MHTQRQNDCDYCTRATRTGSIDEVLRMDRLMEGNNLLGVLDLDYWFVYEQCFLVNIHQVRLSDAVCTIQ